ncbi:MAG TPA: DNA polymerase III subunit gamma/tau [Burkholderiaceae bacterium]|nr:DNA polymerase III subunit gamma/tau [Burkholderiaceae bacterium]
MSYVVLARKYRPRRFAEMVGQEAVVKALTHALEQQRLHHAYLFTGTRGIGKTTVSRILAKSLNCTGPDGQGGITATPCGVCTACTEIDADRYIDYIELDAASNRGIDEIRDLLERAAYKPSVGRFKVFMIDEAHQLTKESFNALLKTLEEPPEYLKFVLATTDPEKMLPTVLSRCLQFNLRPMAPEVVAEYLEKVLGAEQVPFDTPSIRLLARAARGSMRDALSLTDQAIAFSGGRLDEQAVRAMLGSVDRAHGQRIVRALAVRDGRAVLAEVDALREHGLSPSGLLEDLAGLLQQMAIVQAVPDALPEADPDTLATRELASLLPPDETQLLYHFVLHGRGELVLAPDAYAGLAMVLLRLLAFAPSEGASGPGARAPSAPEGVASVRAAGGRASPSAASAAAPPGRGAQAVASAGNASPAAREPREASRPPRAAEPPPWLDEMPPDEAADPAPLPALAAGVSAPSAPTAEPLAPTVLGDRWAGVVAMLLQRNLVTALVRELACQAELVEQTDGAQPLWQLRVERESLTGTALVDKLRVALADALGIATLRLQVERGATRDTPARREAAERERRQREAEAVIRDDPLVQEMLAQFATARIVPGSIKPH